MHEQRLLHKTTLKLILTPQLKQAISLLELPFHKLKTYLEYEAAHNPLFQSSKEDMLACLQEKPSRNSSVAKHNGDELLTQLLQDKPIGLHDHLCQQLRISNINNEILMIAQELITYVDDLGYLRLSPESLSKRLDCDVTKIEEALNIIKSLDPAGVGAKDLQECLLIQLRNKGRIQSLAYQIVSRCFKELAQKKYHLIAKRLKISEEQIKSTLKEIKALNPKPGASYNYETALPIISDAYISGKKNKIEITVNQEALPGFKINDCYQEILRDIDTPDETKQFIREHLHNALWLTKTLSQRNQNILKVVREIAKIQKHAIFEGISATRPLTLKVIAQKTGLHLSTIGRIVAHKHVSTPQGTIKLKDLFSVKYRSKGGKPVSAKHITVRIKDIAASAKIPLTDQKIADTLREEGIIISRRTVAKYRNKLRVPPSFFR